MEVSVLVCDNFIYIVNDIFLNFIIEDLLYNVIVLSSILVVLVVIYIIVRLLVCFQIVSWVYKFNNFWDNVLQQYGFFCCLMYLFFVLFIYLIILVFISDEVVMYGMVIKSVQLYMLYSGFFVLYVMLSIVEDVYNVLVFVKCVFIIGFI